MQIIENPMKVHCISRHVSDVTLQMFIFKIAYIDSFKNKKSYCKQIYIHDLFELLSILFIYRISVNPYYKGNPSSSCGREYLMRGIVRASSIGRSPEAASDKH